VAQPLTCDLCGQENAQLVITNSDNGDVIAVGLSCVVVFYLTAASEMLSMMPAESIAAYADVLAPVIGRLEGMYDDAHSGHLIPASFRADGGGSTEPTPDGESYGTVMHGADGDAQAPAPVTAAVDE
jgi:hypothetical protein